jgi:hypothetical protein
MRILNEILGRQISWLRALGMMAIAVQLGNGVLNGFWFAVAQIAWSALITALETTFARVAMEDQKNGRVAEDEAD